MLVVGSGRGGGGGVQGIDGVLLRFSAARMSALAQSLDQHLAQALPLMYPTATERFFPWWTGHLILRMFPVAVDMGVLYLKCEHITINEPMIRRSSLSSICSNYITFRAGAVSLIAAGNAKTPVIARGDLRDEATG